MQLQEAAPREEEAAERSSSIAARFQEQARYPLMAALVPARTATGAVAVVLRCGQTPIALQASFMRLAAG
jgi:hypothetical protein